MLPGTLYDTFKTVLRIRENLVKRFASVSLSLSPLSSPLSVPPSYSSAMVDIATGLAAAQAGMDLMNRNKFLEAEETLKPW